MKKLIFIFFLCAFASDLRAQLIQNGNFEHCRTGDVFEISAGGTNTIDNMTFANFRAYDVVAAKVGVKVEIIDGGSNDAPRAMSISVKNTDGTPPGGFGIDFNNNRVRVTPGKISTFSFDAKNISGDHFLTVTLQPFDSKSVPMGVAAIYQFEVSSPEYNNFTVTYTPPQGADTLNVAFSPEAGQKGKSTVAISNLQFVVPNSGSDNP
jgi:hypothetical protein